MPRIEEHIDIAAAPADVFRLCHDVASRPDWDEQVMRVELLTPRPIRRGTLVRIDGRHSGSSIFSWEAEYVDFRFPVSSKLRVIDTASSSPFAPGSEVSWQFSSMGSDTRFSWVWTYRPQGIVSRILDNLGRRASTQRAIRSSLVRLKEMIEQGRRAGSN